MRALLIALTLVAGACASPLEPTSSHPSKGIEIDARMQPAWNLARTLPAQSWTRGKSVAEWLDGLPITAIRVEPLNGITADYNLVTHVIRVNSQSQFPSLEPLAAVLLHEARHADGFMHTCGNNDQTFSELGAWAVQVLALDAFNRPDISTVIRAHHFCEGGSR